jgi:hypothetical protein
MATPVQPVPPLDQASAGWFSRAAAGFKPPNLPPVSRRAFRFHMAFTLLYAFFEGVMANAPLMAVKAMSATDVQLQLPIGMTSLGLFGAVFFGAAMARQSKKPFVLVPGFAGAFVALLMACTSDAGRFLFLAGVVSICDFAMRPAVPSIMRIVYPDLCRSRVSGTMRQYGSIVFLGATLSSAALLSEAGPAGVIRMIHMEIAAAGLACAAAFASFGNLPALGDGCVEEAALVDDLAISPARAVLAPFGDKRFRYYLAAIFVFSFGNLFHQGVVPSFFARDMGLGYVQATLLIHVIPNLTAFLSGGYLTSWFERTSVWRSYSLVTLFWGLDPLILATASSIWPAVVVGRILRGPATLGSMVSAFFSGVHSFARPGVQTSRYMAAQFLINGIARLAAPAAAAILLAYLSRRSIILYGSLAILASSFMFGWAGRRRSR